MPARAIFRESAVEAYRRRTEKDVLPRLVSRPIIVCCWLLLGVLVAAAVLAWSVRVPAFADASGVIVGPGVQQPLGGEPAAILFAPTDRSASVHPGQSVHMQVGTAGTYLHGAVVRVEPGTIGPDVARDRYGLGDAPEVITQPSTVVIVRLGEAPPPAAYGGSRVTAQVEVGSRRPLDLLLGFGAGSGAGS